MQICGYVFHDTDRQLSNIEDPVVPLERNVYLLELEWEKVPNWECLCVLKKQGLCFSVYVDDIKIAGNKQNTAPV